MDFSFLEGKQVEVFGAKCYIAGCEYDIGITIVEEKTKDRIICLDRNGETNEKYYSKLFNQMVYNLMVYDSYTDNDFEIVKKIMKEQNRIPTNKAYIPVDACAFSK